jgi:succinate-semialdehyde dehydrogenase/glutarate-semialdehyde dehydrogenase
VSLQLKDPTLLRQQSYINGQWVDADSRGTLDVTNPATGEKIGTVPKMGVAETRRAIEAASAAMPAWAKKTAKERAVILRRWYDLMMTHQDDLAVIMTAEQGKPLAESKGEIAYAASFIEWFAEEGKRMYGDVIPGHLPDKRILVLRQPVGVVAGITPWNFPAAMITRKAGPALAAGCTFVCKPATQTPYSAFAMAELAARAGVPAGVLNILTGGSTQIGGEMTSNPIVRKITFTGSTEVGKKLMAQSVSTLKKLSMELGGNAPFIVFDDADLDAAVAGAMASKYRNTGQTCVCANRILVQSGVYDASRASSGSGFQLRVGMGSRAPRTRAPSSTAKPSRRWKSTSRMPSPRAPKWPSAASAMPSAARFSSPRCSRESPPAWPWPAKKPSARWLRCSGSRPKKMPFAWPTTRSSASPPISIPGTSRAPGAFPRRWNTASSASTRASSLRKWRRLAA